MWVAVGSDEVYPVHDVVIGELTRRGHDVVRFGSTASGREEPWALVAEAAASAVAHGDCDEGILFCWTGTGIAMAANKVVGVRAALVTDAATAAASRVWNHANVLCLSNRLVSADIAKEILAAWLDTPPGEQGTAGVRALEGVEVRHRGRP
jgi:ribose 5-phosphate isomerase B